VLPVQAKQGACVYDNECVCVCVCVCVCADCSVYAEMRYGNHWSHTTPARCLQHPGKPPCQWHAPGQDLAWLCDSCVRVSNDTLFFCQCNGTPACCLIWCYRLCRRGGRRVVCVCVCGQSIKHNASDTLTPHMSRGFTVSKKLRKL
jgi:hypothetical protein